MAQWSLLGDMLTTLFERRWSGPGVSEGRTIEDMCLALLDSEGEVSGLRLAKAILQTYARLDASQKRAFFLFLNQDLEIDVAGLQSTLTRFAASQKATDYRALAAAAEPRRQELLRRLNQSTGATRALVSMREDLLDILPDVPELQRTDLDFQHLLRSWFNRGFLVLRQIHWDTPASILEKIVAYEAVHAINDWDDLRRRVYPPDRKCYAYFHPTMPDEPLIFVEIALTRYVPNSIQHVLAEDRDIRDPEDARVAVFYSISNCQRGLTGVSFGNLLIKQVVDELRLAVPSVDTFVTLSPIPKLNSWLKDQKNDPLAARALAGTARSEELRQLAETYLLTAKSRDGAPRDPVARFHLGNGAQVFAIHSGADLSEKGLRQSSGAMVNYHYDLSLIERNHESFVQHGHIPTAPTFRSARSVSA